MRIKNNSEGARIFHARTGEKDHEGKDVVRPHMVDAGQEADLDVVNPDHPVHKAWRDSGEVEFGGSSRSKPAPEDGEGGGEPDFEAMTVEELRAYIADHDATPAPGARKADLIEQAASL